MSRNSISGLPDKGAFDSLENLMLLDLKGNPISVGADNTVTNQEYLRPKLTAVSHTETLVKFLRHEQNEWSLNVSW